MPNQVQTKFDELASQYADKYTHPTGILHFEKIRRMALLLEYTRSLQPAFILDAGCGSGVVLSALKSELPSSEIAGADLSYLMLKQAQAINIAGTLFLQARVEQLPFADNSFDFVYALGVIDYLDNPKEFFQVVHRIMKPDGYFIFTYPNGDSINRMLRTGLRTYLRRSQQTVSSISVKPAMVDRLIEDHGFELLQRDYITYGNGMITLPWSVSLSEKFEKWCHRKPIGRYLGWTGVCAVRVTKGMT